MVFLGPDGKYPARILYLSDILDGLYEKNVSNKQITQCQQYKEKKQMQVKFNSTRICVFLKYHRKKRRGKKKAISAVKMKE